MGKYEIGKAKHLSAPLRMLIQKRGSKRSKQCSGLFKTTDVSENDCWSCSTYLTYRPLSIRLCSPEIRSGISENDMLLKKCELNIDNFIRKADILLCCSLAACYLYTILLPTNGFHEEGQITYQLSSSR
jgi:hypothetical protein